MTYLSKRNIIKKVETNNAGEPIANYYVEFEERYVKKHAFSAPTVETRKIIDKIVFDSENEALAYAENVFQPSASLYLFNDGCYRLIYPLVLKTPIERGEFKNHLILCRPNSSQYLITDVDGHSQLTTYSMKSLLDSSDMKKIIELYRHNGEVIKSILFKDGKLVDSPVISEDEETTAYYMIRNDLIEQELARIEEYKNFLLALKH